jgi:transposase
MQTLHRTRDRAVGERTSLMNQLPASAANSASNQADTRAQLLSTLPQKLGDPLIEDMLAAWQALDERIAA